MINTMLRSLLLTIAFVTWAIPALAGGISGIAPVAFMPTPHGWPVQVIPVGDHVLLSNGETYRGLQNIDWSDPAHPRLAQWFDTGNTNAAMVRLGNRVYVLANYYGVSMFGIGKDGMLTKLGRWRMPPPANHGRRMVGIATDGRQYLYLHIKPEGAWKDWPAHPDKPEAGLYLLDVTRPGDVRMHFVGKMSVFDTIRGGFGFIAQGKYLQIYALDRPERPRLVGAYQAEGKITAVCVDGAHAWLTVRGTTLELLDVGNHSNPQLLARSQAQHMNHATSIVARNEWAWVLQAGNAYNGPDHGLQIFRWHNDALTHVGHVRWPNSNMLHIVLHGNIAYATDNYYGVRRLNFGRPDTPQQGALFMSAGEAQQLLLQGHTGLLNLEWGGTVAILDVSDPLHIHINGYYRPGHFDDYAVGMAGDYFYYGKRAKRQIVDIRDPAHPVVAGDWTLPGMPLMPPVKSGHYFFEWLAAGKRQVELAAFDMRDPLHPKLAGSLTMPPELTVRFGAAATDGKRLFAVANNGIVAVDISNPGAMRLIGSYAEAGVGARAPYTWQGAGRRAALNGGYLYVIQGSEQADTPRIAVIDVSDPAHMRQVYITPDTPPTFQEDWFDERLVHQGDMLNDMLMHDGRLYVSDYWGGVRVYDCSIPFRPQLVRWEFAPYLALMPADWSRARYRQAIASGHLHASLGLDAATWARRRAIGRRLLDLPLAYRPGYGLFAWNIGGFVGDRLLQPKLGGIAIYDFGKAAER